MKYTTNRKSTKIRICTWMISIFLMIGPAMPVFATESGTGRPGAEGKETSGEVTGMTGIPEEGTILPTVTKEILESTGEDDSEEMFAEYVDRLFEGENADSSSGGRRKARKNTGSKFTGGSQIIYIQICSGAKEIADGQRASSEFAFSAEDLGYGQAVSWSAADLGISAVVTDNSITDDAVNAAMERFENDLQIDAITSALLADCPYELYWHDKVVGVRRHAQFGAAYTGGEWKIYITGEYTVALAVANEFAVSQYVADTEKTGAASQAVENANNILTEYQSLSDIQKLYAYKNAICDAVDYNYEAANDYNMAYGNPWQLIWVFDGDAATKVVCEGYSKAFQYLCDKTEFTHSDICAYSVTGDMVVYGDGGAHMWNIVTLDDGYHYLADVTNSDSGSVGQDGELFLVPFTSGSVEEGYSFRCDNNADVLYFYDDEMAGLYSTEDLTIASWAYGTSLDPDFVLPGNLEKIEEEAFSGINASVIVLPDSVDTIGSKAFSNCANLVKIYIPETTETISEDAFLNDTNLTIFGRENSPAALFARNHGYTFIDTFWHYERY